MMKRILMAALLLLSLPALADFTRSDRAAKPAQPGPESLRLADPAVLRSLQEQDRKNPGLPRDMTLQERRMWRPPEFILPERDQIPAYNLLRAQAEYEPNDAILMRWGHQNAVLTSMIVPITTGDSQARVMLIVSGQSQQNSATTTLNNAGANLNRIDFIQAPSDSVWIRDYGPRFASGDYNRIIIDHEYDRPRPADNAVPGQIANALELPIYKLPLDQGGGNYHGFANGEAFITDTILWFNPGVSQQQVKNYFAAYQGVDLTFLGTLGADQNGGTTFPWYDGTGHLDMWFLPTDDSKVIIGEYSPTEWNGIPHQVTEDAVALMEQRGFKVLRTPGWRTGGTHYTYTNAVIVNDLVLTCTFSGYPAQNAQAQAAFEQAFPDRTIVPVDCSNIIGLSGALHCIVKHMPWNEDLRDRLSAVNWSRQRPD
jgi:agmatine deiminase